MKVQFRLDSDLRRRLAQQWFEKAPGKLDGFTEVVTVAVLRVFDLPGRGLLITGDKKHLQAKTLRTA